MSVVHAVVVSLLLYTLCNKCQTVPRIFRITDLGVTLAVYSILTQKLVPGRRPDKHIPGQTGHAYILRYWYLVPLIKPPWAAVLLLAGPVNSSGPVNPCSPYGPFGPAYY